MGPKPTKPEVGDDATIHCDSDTGFKLIQINLDWNNNGDDGENEYDHEAEETDVCHFGDDLNYHLD